MRNNVTKILTFSNQFLALYIIILNPLELFSDLYLIFIDTSIKVCFFCESHMQSKISAQSSGFKFQPRSWCATVSKYNKE